MRNIVTVRVPGKSIVHLNRHKTNKQYRHRERETDRDRRRKIRLSVIPGHRTVQEGLSMASSLFWPLSQACQKKRRKHRPTDTTSLRFPFETTASIEKRKEKRKKAIFFLVKLTGQAWRAKMWNIKFPIQNMLGLCYTPSLYIYIRKLSCVHCHGTRGLSPYNAAYQSKRNPDRSWQKHLHGQPQPKTWSSKGRLRLGGLLKEDCRGGWTLMIGPAGVTVCVCVRACVGACRAV